MTGKVHHGREGEGDSKMAGMGGEGVLQGRSTGEGGNKNRSWWRRGVAAAVQGSSGGGSRAAAVAAEGR